MNAIHKSKKELIEEIELLRKENELFKKQQLITNSKALKVQKELERKSDELENYFTNALDLFCIADTNGYFVKINKEWETTLGYKIDELEGHKFLDFIHPDDLDSTLKAIVKLSRQEEIINFVNRYRTKDGLYKYIEWRSRPSGKRIYAAARDITEQKLKEKQLHYERTLLRTVIDNIPDLIYAKDVEAKKTLANKADIGLMGLHSEAEALSKDDFAFYPIERANEFYAEDKKVIDTGEPAINTEGFHIDEVGKWRWFITSKYPLKDANGKIVGLVGIGRDITDHKLREVEKERLLETAYLRQATIVTLSSHQSIITGDIRNAARMVTETVTSMMNIERASVWLFNEEKTEICCMDLFELSLQNHSDGAIIKVADYPAYFQSLKDGQCINASDAQTNPLTSEFTDTYLKPLNICSMLGTPIRVDGHVVGIIFQEQLNVKRIWEPNEILFASELADQIAIAFTNAKKQKAEFELRTHLDHQNSLVKLLQSNANNVQKFLDLTLEEAINLTSSKIGFIYHYNESRKEFVLNSWSNEAMKECSIVNPETTYKLEKTGFWGEVVRQRKEIIANDFQADNPFKKGYPEGHVMLKKYLSIPFFQGDQIVAVVGVANKEKDYIQTDVLNIQFLMNSAWGKLIAIQSEEALRRSESNLRELNIAKDKFFSIIAHDLKSPFQGFINLTEAMAEDVGSFTLAELAKFSMEINKSARTLFKLLKNLLDWSQIQNGNIEFVPKQCSLNDIVSHNIELQKLRCYQKGITIINNISDPHIVKADENMINSIFRNLLSNAVKFTPPGGEINIGVRNTHNNFMEIFIKDSGIGMTNAFVERLFKIEEKVGRKGTEGEESSSLGLILCKEFVEKHGGRIWVESLENNGSTFYFTVPQN